MDQQEIEAFDNGWDAAMNSLAGAWTNFVIALLNLLLCFIPRKYHHNKHLSDTELAAEYWRLKADHLSVAPVIESNTEINRKIAIMRRFATHPHAHGDHL